MNKVIKKILQILTVTSLAVAILASNYLFAQEGDGGAVEATQEASQEEASVDKEAAKAEKAAAKEAKKQSKLAEAELAAEAEEETMAPLDFTPLEQMEPLSLPAEVADVTNRTSIGYGLIASNTFYTDASNDYSIFMGYYRPYAKFLFLEKHSGMIRLNLSNTMYMGDTTNAPENAFTPKVELFYFDFLPTYNYKISVGRQFFKVGKGVLFSNYADGLKVKSQFGNAVGELFVAYSGAYGSCFISIEGCGDNVRNPYSVIPGITPDASSGWDATGIGQRLFVGLDWKIGFIPGSEQYLSVLYSRDLMKEEQGIQYKLKYHPVYLAAGSKGYIFLPELRYHLEGIIQSGTTYSLMQTEASRITAGAFLFDLAYGIPLQNKKYKPNLLFQFAMASGDEDKMSVNLPTGTNVKKADSAFFYFGNYSGGLGLKPMLSNLMVVRGGFNVRPAASWYPGRDLTLLVKYSYYKKRVAEGVVSDERAISVYTAGLDSTHDHTSTMVLGSAVDTTVVWKVTSDLNIYYNMGIFLPGNAFFEEDQVTESVHLLSATLMF